MTGLIMKDLLVMRKTMKSYLLIIVLYVVLAYLDVLNYGFIITFIQVMLMVLPITAFAYDEQAKWDRYAVALPLGRSRVVGARYLFVLMLTVITTAMGLVGTAILTLVHEAEPLEMLLTLAVSTTIGLLVPAILLPLCYKLGAELFRPQCSGGSDLRCSSWGPLPAAPGGAGGIAGILSHLLPHYGREGVLR